MFIITGASSGIGNATAKALAARGREVFAVARNADRLAELKESYPNLISVMCADLSSTEQLDNVITAIRSMEHVSGVVHAAGSAIPLAHYKSLQANELLSHMALHTAVPIALNNQLTSKLTGSRILYIDSYSANAPRVGWSGYSIVKAAAQMAARSAAAEMKDSKVIRVYPGAVRTPLVDAVLTSSQGSTAVEDFKAMQSAGKISDAATIGAYLSSILLDATEQQIDEREYWDFNNPKDKFL